jgi:hypothetical protein
MCAENQVGDTGAAALGSALGINTTLTKLNLASTFRVV